MVAGYCRVCSSQYSYSGLEIQFIMDPTGDQAVAKNYRTSEKFTRSHFLAVIFLFCSNGC